MAQDRLVIRAFKKPDFSDPAGEFQAYVNPNEITFGYEYEWDAAQGSGTTGSRMNFKKAKPGDLNLTFFLDGTGANGRPLTGANGQPLDVQKKVEEFHKVTGYEGGIHRPNYLEIAWGTLPVKKCVLKTASVAYKLFRDNGVPLRAIITAVFIDTSDDKTRVAKAKDKSPDLTHVRLMKAGDSLPKLCQEIYGNPRLYVAIAQFNGFDDFRSIAPGTRILFPPLEK